MLSFANATLKLSQGAFDSGICSLYSCLDEEIGRYRARFLRLLEHFGAEFGTEAEVSVFSASGRSEICGNHTDHQNGKVMAAAVNLDTIAAVALAECTMIRVFSEGYGMICVDGSDVKRYEDELNTTKAILRGLCAKFQERGYFISGFDAYVTSDVLKGSGLSSSASFEILLATMMNSLFCRDELLPMELAQLCQTVENDYFGKPSGLMDQAAIAMGGFVKFDFFHDTQPLATRIHVDFSKCGFALCIVDTKGNHADLTGEYAAITAEMKSVAAYFGETVLSRVDPAIFYQSIGSLRSKVSDRAILRATHFFRDNALVDREEAALNQGDFGSFLKDVVLSGQSSFMYLQNVYSCQKPEEQGLAVALSICDRLLGERGAYRVHGGGFGGTIQAFVPKDMVTAFSEEMESAMGEGTCQVLFVRSEGAIKLF